MNHEIPSNMEKNRRKHTGVDSVDHHAHTAGFDTRQLAQNQSGGAGDELTLAGDY
jgi:hypothetical protein